MRKSIFRAGIIQFKNSPSAASSKAAGRAVDARLLCLTYLFGAFVGAQANASASLSLRITLATAGLPNIQAPFAAPSSTPPSADQHSARTAARTAAQAKAAAQAQLRAQVKALVKVYAAMSDAELTALSAQLQDLPRLDRQVLLREVKMRMARQRGRKGSVQIRTERRFGRLLRQADGSVVRVETRVVQVRPATKDEQASQTRVRKSGYGTGFGRRAASQPEPPPSADAKP